MKRFLRNVLLLALVCCLLLMTLSELYLVTLRTDYQRYKDSTLRLKDMPYDIDVASFGSSHAGNAFQGQRYHDGVLYAMSLALQTPELDYAMYRHFRDHFSDDATVVITLSTFSLYWQPTFAEYCENIKRYCLFLPFSCLPSAKAKFYRLFRICDFQASDVRDYFANKQPGTPPSAESSSVATRFTADELAQVGRARSQTHLDMCASSPDGKVSRAMDRALTAMLTDCAEHGYRVILVTTPYLDEYNRCLPQELLDRFSRDANAYADAFGVPYLDYSHDERFTHAPELFIDADHLTSEGSEIFMQIVFADADAFYAQKAGGAK